MRHKGLFIDHMKSFLEKHGDDPIVLMSVSDTGQRCAHANPKYPTLNELIRYIKIDGKEMTKE